MDDFTHEFRIEPVAAAKRDKSADKVAARQREVAHQVGHFMTHAFIGESQ